MSDYEIRVDGEPVAPAAGWRLDWDGSIRGVARLRNGERSIPVLVEGSGSDWHITIRGRRVPVTVRTWRERLLAEAATDAQVHTGPVTVSATLPGLVVAVAVGVGDEVEEGASLLTIEAMKMQNEVRAPRSGRVIEVSVTAGATVATGTSLMRLE